MAKTALIIGGGAPNATLMAGALVAFEEAGVEFDVVSTAGAGALIGLLYLAPQGGDSLKALRSTVDMGIADALYQRYPVNFKVFQKSGSIAEAYRALLQANPLVQAMEQQLGGHEATRLQADLIKLMFAVACPTDLNADSLGLCAPVPFLEQVVDFSALQQRHERFYVNAYNINDRRMQNFSSAKGQISGDALRAALAFPFLYPPHQMVDPEDGQPKYYYEGAAHDCLNYEALVSHEPEVKDIVVFDVLGAEKLMRTPRDLYDAWLLSIIVPLVEIARDDTKIFEAKYNRDGKWNLLKVPFDIPADKWETSLDWSRSNLETLFQVGYDSGRQFLAGAGSHLPRPGQAAKPSAPAKGKRSPKGG